MVMEVDKNGIVQQWEGVVGRFECQCGNYWNWVGISWLMRW